MRSKIFAVSVLILAMMAPPRDAQGEAHSVTIAVEVPVFDWFPETALYVDAAELALHERGGQVCGGWPVNIELSDHGSEDEFVDVSKVRYNAHRHVADRSVGAVLGPLTSTSAFTLVPIANRAGLLVVSPANTLECLTSPAKDCFDDVYPTGTRNYARTIAHNAIEGSKQADLAGTLLTDDRTAIYIYRIDDDGREYGGPAARAFAARAPAVGVNLIDTIPYADHFYDPPNFPEKVTRILAADPELVVFAGMDEGFEFVRELRGRGYTGKLLVGNGIFEQAWRLFDEVGPAAEGMYATVAGHVPESYDRPRPGVDFADAFTAWAGQPPSYRTAEAYLAAHIILDAFETACAAEHLPTDRDAVTAAALATEIRTPPYFGDYSLDGHGDPVSAPVALYRATRGTFVYQTSVR
jgi:branched-chain amino acid transport system substrate-binding protein